MRERECKCGSRKQEHRLIIAHMRRLKRKQRDTAHDNAKGAQNDQRLDVGTRPAPGQKYDREECRQYPEDRDVRRNKF